MTCCKLKQMSDQTTLSDERIDQILQREQMKWSSREGPPTYDFAKAFARAIEAHIRREKK